MSVSVQWSVIAFDCALTLTLALTLFKEVGVDIPKINYTGKIKEVTIGVGEKKITVGGEGMYPFHLFEGQMSHPPRIAMEVYDAAPGGLGGSRPGAL